MHALLITNIPEKGEFIAKGLTYEQLPTDVKPLSEIVPEELVLNYDGVFLFLKSPGDLGDLIQKCTKIKNIPVILLTQEYDVRLVDLFHRNKKVCNLFIRPFPFRLIASEMRFQIFLRKEKVNNTILRIRNLELNREAREIKLYNETIYLRSKEFALLEFLMLNQGKVLSRGTILENVWDRNTNILTNTVDVHINKLRKKLHKGTEQFIRTIPCSGYVFS